MKIEMMKMSEKITVEMQAVATKNGITLTVPRNIGIRGFSLHHINKCLFHNYKQGERLLVGVTIVRDEAWGKIFYDIILHEIKQLHV